MPPINDNFANAIALDPASSAVIVSNNIGATAEVGEPQFGLKSVWYKITIPTGLYQSLYFSTQRNRQLNPLRTFIQVFIPRISGALSVSNLQEVPYLAAQKTSFGGWDFGGQVALATAIGQTYYLRIDGVSGAEGNFELRYGQYFSPRLGSCSSCATVFGVGYSCAGQTGQNYQPVSSPVLSFGKSSYPPGRYVVRYCGGAIRLPEAVGEPEPIGEADYIVQKTLSNGNDIVPAIWTVYYNGSSRANLHPPGQKTTTQRALLKNVATLTVIAHGFPTGQHVMVKGLIGVSNYNLSEVAITKIDADHFSYPCNGTDELTAGDTNGIVTPVDQASLQSVPAVDIETFQSQAAAEQAFLCAFAQCDHLGGNIQIGLSMFAYQLPNAGIGANPVWGLYLVSPVLTLGSSIFIPSVCVNWNTLPSGGTPGNTTVSFGIANQNDIDWDLVTATLQTTGGVSLPTTVKNITLPRLGLAQVSIDFSAMDTNVTASLVLTCPFWANPVIMPIYLGPIIQFGNSSGPILDVNAHALNRTCSGKNIYDFVLYVQNVGFWGYAIGDLTLTASATNGVLVGDYNRGVAVGQHGGTFPVTNCPPSSSGSIYIYSGLPCPGGFGAGNQTIALCAPASATAPVRTVLSVAVTASGVPLFSQDFPLTVQL